MINKHIEELLLYDDSELMIKSEDVATVRIENTLLHAMMVLSTVGYSSIPVLDNQHRLQGTVTLPRIIEGVKDQIHYDWDQLSQKRVKDVICHDYSPISVDADLEDVLHKLVDHNFVCITDNEGIFLGIITRKSILKRVNFLVHEIDNYFDLSIKEDKFSFKV
ncbi:MAG TPA: cyclic-di-AMP-binding protein CbpB [Candidatus Eisenbacteria bacterium]|nr:cyclic-di-AMP-binding protein CbpB [Candidatus Eisenbacteria bacterium]